MNKFFRTVAITAVIALAGCCGKAQASQEAKLSVDAVAQAGFNNLSADQQAQVLQSITAAQSKDTATVDKVDKWVNVGERIGKMMGGAAKEIGIAANDFVKTDVGRMTAMLIIWNYMGNDFVHIFVHVGGGLLFIAIAIPSIFYAVRRSQRYDIKYDPTAKTWLGRPRVVSMSRSPLSGEMTFLMVVAIGVSLGIGSAILLNV